MLSVADTPSALLQTALLRTAARPARLRLLDSRLSHSLRRPPCSEMRIGSPLFDNFNTHLRYSQSNSNLINSIAFSYVENFG